MELTSTFSILVLGVVFLIWIWLKNKFNYWHKKGVVTPPYSLIWGNMKSAFLQKNSFLERMSYFYQYFKSQGLKHGAVYYLWVPMYMPVDLKIIKHIMQIDFQYFTDRGLYSNEKIDPLSGHLIALGGRKWRLLRNKLTPTFTSGKMKTMYPTLLECTRGLYKALDNELGQSVDIKDILGRFTIDIIGSCAFGIDCNSLENPDSEFRDRGKAVIERNKVEQIKQLLLLTMPDLMRKLKAHAVPVEVSKFFMGIVKDTVNFREKNNVSRKDFMQLLIQLKNRGKLVDDDKLPEEMINEEDNRITIEEIAAQALIFFIAGYETSSTTMTFCLYEVAKNRVIQEKIREEIKQALEAQEGKLTYDSVMNMTYLEQVINETLRKYPPIPGVPRVCNKRYAVPGTDLVLEKGTRVMIPIVGIHFDPEYYPNPDRFDPDRFSEGNKKNLKPFSFLAFGEGPRICIGARFGMMQTKVGIIALLLNYELSVNKKTQEPLQFDPPSLVTSTKGGMWLNFKKISSNPVELVS